VKNASWLMTAVMLSIAAGCGGDPASPGPDASSDVIVYVVRHAETGSTAADPSLDATGQARAAALAARLDGAGITAAFASQYKRTRETAMPTAAAAGIAVTVVPATATNTATYGAELVTAVRDSGAHAALIVGHSNTVPDTVEAFTGATVTAIEETEFDRIFTITLATDGPHLEEGHY
jgi:phosphohistidine phosphatase SixA